MQSGSDGNVSELKSGSSTFLILTWTVAFLSPPLIISPAIGNLHKIETTMVYFY